MLTRTTDADMVWIAPETRGADMSAPIETTYFKLLFNVPDIVGAKANIVVAANSRFCLYVNGQAVLNGPCKGAEWYQFCDKPDITPYLKAGVNVLAVKVAAFPNFLRLRADRSNWGPTSVMTDACGTLLLLDGMVTLADGATVSLSTKDADWHCRADDAISWHHEEMTWLAGCFEDVDGTRLPHGWTEHAEMGEGFTKAIIARGNSIEYGEFTKLMLFERPIPFLLREKHPALTALPGTGELRFGTDGTAICPPHTTQTIVLEAPRLTTAYVALRTEGGQGSVVTLSYSEGYVQRDDTGREYKKHRKDTSGVFQGVIDTYRPGGGAETYEPFWFRTLMLLKIEVTTTDEALTIRLPELTETRYPLECRAEAASGAQDWVKPVWDISLRTLQLCMHETYEDCPFYEQLQYIMDTRLQILFTYAVGNDTRMAKRTIHDFHSSMLPEGICQSRYPAMSPQVIPVFALHWVLMLHDYAEETGDLAFVEPYIPSVERIFEWFRSRKNELGLAAKLEYWDFADWADEWKNGIPNAARADMGVSTINNLCYAYVMQMMAPVFTRLGMDTLAARYANEARDVLSAVRTHCWSNERQLLREAPDLEEYSQHAQMWAVLCGLFTGGEAQAIMHKTLTDKSLVQCSFVMQFYLFRALEAAGIYESTEHQWELWRGLLNEGLSTVPEIPGPYTRSDCHAWGALMLYEFPRKALGVTILEPGYAKVQIKPIALYLQSASGTVPTPHGAVSVDWESNGGRFCLRAETPVPARIVLPDGNVMEVEPGVYSYSISF